MVFVFGLVLVDVIILIIHTTLEGVVTHFRVGTDINKEKTTAFEGVGWTSIPFLNCIVIIYLTDIN
jgi:uncharacterized membrane protein